MGHKIDEYMRFWLFKSKYHEIILSSHFNIFLETASEKMKMPVPSYRRHLKFIYFLIHPRLYKAIEIGFQYLEFFK